LLFLDYVIGCFLWLNTAGLVEWASQEVFKHGSLGGL
jgi:hypothetical protein